MKVLQHLIFRIKCPRLSVSAVFFLAQNCRRLVCDMSGAFVLAEIDKVRTRPLFPELRELLLGRAVDRGEEEE